MTHRRGGGRECGAGSYRIISRGARCRCVQISTPVLCPSNSDGTTGQPREHLRTRARARPEETPGFSAVRNQRPKRPGARPPDLAARLRGHGAISNPMDPRSGRGQEKGRRKSASQTQTAAASRTRAAEACLDRGCPIVLQIGETASWRRPSPLRLATQDARRQAGSPPRPPCVRTRHLVPRRCPTFPPISSPLCRRTGAFRAAAAAPFGMPEAVRACTCGASRVTAVGTAGLGTGGDAAARVRSSAPTHRTFALLMRATARALHTPPSCARTCCRAFAYRISPGGAA